MLKTVTALIHAAEKENVVNAWTITEAWANYQHATLVRDTKELITDQLTTT
jgi:hypothetical protein